MVSDPGLSAMVDRLTRLSSDLEQAASGLAQQRHDLLSADGWVRVVVDGRPRVVSLAIDPNLPRYGSDALDQALTAGLNQALTAARSARAQALLDVLPPGLREGVESTMDERS